MTLPPDIRRVLRERALALSHAPAVAEGEEARLESVEFVLANERYAIETSHLGGVHPLRDLTPLPCTPPFLMGIINERGRVLAVIDLKKFFELPERGIDDLHIVLVVRAEGMELGILADHVVGVRSLPRTDLQPPLPTLTGIRELYLKGVTPDRVAILDAGRILSDPRILIHEEVAVRKEVVQS